MARAVAGRGQYGAAPPDVPLIDGVKSADADAVRALLERSIDVNAPVAGAGVSPEQGLTNIKRVSTTSM